MTVSRAASHTASSYRPSVLYARYRAMSGYLRSCLSSRITPYLSPYRQLFAIAPYRTRIAPVSVSPLSLLSSAIPEAHAMDTSIQQQPTSRDSHSARTHDASHPSSVSRPAMARHRRRFGWRVRPSIDTGNEVALVMLRQLLGPPQRAPIGAGRVGTPRRRVLLGRSLRRRIVYAARCRCASPNRTVFGPRTEQQGR